MAKYSEEISAIFDQAEQQGNYLEPVKIRPVAPKPSAEPVATPEDQPGVLSDVGSMYGVGSNQILEGLGWLVDSKSLQEAGRSGQDYWRDKLSDKQVEAGEKRWVSEEGGPGEALTNWRSYVGIISQSLPHLALGGGAASVAGRGAMALGATQKTAATVGAVTASTFEGTTIGAMVGADIDSTIRAMSEDEKMISPMYQDLRGRFDEEEATSQFSDSVAKPAAWKSGAFGAAVGYAFNRYLSNAVLGRLRGSRGAEALKGGTLEGFTELGQEGGQAYIQQKALNDAVGRPMNYPDMANQAVGGLAAGTAMGSGIGLAAGGGRQPEPTPDPADRLSEEALRARAEAEANGGDSLDAANAATRSLTTNLADPYIMEQPVGDIQGLMTQAQLQESMAGASDAERAAATPGLWSASTAPRPYDISAMGRNLASPPAAGPAPLSERMGDEPQGPEIAYQQDGVTVTRDNNRFEARQDGSDLVTFGNDVAEARRKLSQLIERNTPKAPVLQNRDRSGRGYIDQMEQIAAKPDYDQVSTSRTPEAGAPMVFAQGNAPTVLDTDLGRTETITMSDGAGGNRKIESRYAVVEASSLKASHGADGKKNESYGRDGLIALNNGRTAGLQEAYNRGTANDYRNAMLADAEQTGIAAAAIESKANPVLIRLFDGAQLEGINDPGAASNAERGASLSMSERAQTDARKLTPDVLAKLRTGDPLGSDNAEFVASAIEAMSGGETNTAMRDSNTGLLTAEGQKRLRGALIERAFTDKTLSQELVEATDSDLKTFADALQTVAGRWALMREKAKDGSINSDMDVTDALTAAINMIRKSRQEGVALKDLAGQVDAFAGEADQTAVHILSLFYRGANFNRARRKDVISGALLNYVETALQTSAEADMFGNITTPDQVLERERGKLDSTQEEAAPRIRPDGPDNRTGGQEGQGRGNRTERAQNAEEGATPEVAADPDFDLAAQTETDLAEQAAAKAESDKAEAQAKRDADQKEKAAADRAFVKGQSEAAADTFELGGNAMDNLTGQSDIFSATPPAEPAAGPVNPYKSGDERDAAIDRLQGSAPSWAATGIKDAAEFGATEAEIAKALEDVTADDGAALQSLAAEKAMANSGMKQGFGSAKQPKLQPSVKGESHPIIEDRYKALGALSVDQLKAIVKALGGRAPRNADKSTLGDRIDDFPVSEIVKAYDFVAGEPESKPDQEAPAAESPAAPIEDFGQKIEGARKDYASKLTAAKEKDIAAVPLSESWPEPDYQKMLDAGVDPESVGFAHAIRDDVPVKPRKGWKLKGWAEKVETLRSFMESVIAGDITMEQVREQIGRLGSRQLDSGLLGRAELYTEMGHSKSLKGLKFHEAHFSLWNGQENVNKWLIERTASTGSFGNMPRQMVATDTKEQAIAEFRKVYESLDQKGKAEKTTRFDIYSNRYDRNDVFIGKKIGKDVVRIKEGFTTPKEARIYLAENQDMLEGILAKMKNIPNHRKESNSPRVGKDHRSGGDVTPEAFAEAFGFRGVQFGNYVEQGKRQQDLNDAYDGLMDLAGILNIPAKALSLNGELGLAFGARGKGGKVPAKAHYEPGSIVINLTKKNGAGSLAHEWFHSMDNYFGRAREAKASGNMATDGNPDAAVRPEVAEAFRAIRKTVNRMKLRERSRNLDKVRTKAYWATDVEMTARSFESYVIEKLKDQSASNDYLANIVSEEFWQASEALGMEESNSYPYPGAAEIPEIRAVYDALFEVIETVEQPDGAIMLREQDGVPYYQVNEDQIALDFDAEPDNDGEAGNLQSGQRGAGNAATEAANAGRRAPRLQNQRQTTRQIERQSFFHGLREVTSAAEAAHVLAPFRKDAHETFLALVLDDSGRPLAIVRHSKGTIDGAAVYPSQFVADVVSVPGVKSVWLSHNHPSGTMAPSESDLNLTEKLSPILKDAGVGLEGHVIIGFGRAHTAFALPGGYSSIPGPTVAAVRSHRIPVLERQIKQKSGMKNAVKIKAPQDAVSALRDIAGESQTGVMLLDNAHRPTGFLDLSGYDLEALRGTSAYRDVLQSLAATNASAGIVQAGSGVSDTDNLQRMLGDLEGFRLLDAVHVDILKGRDVNYTSVQEINGPDGGVARSGTWFSRSPRYRRNSSQATPNLTAAQAEIIKDELLKGWTAKPDIVIADRISEFPSKLRQAIREAGAESDMRGVFFEGKVYILASRLPTRAAMEEVILHEVVGHYGLRKMVGAALKPMLNQVYLNFAGTDKMKEIIRNYYPKGDFDASNVNHRMTVAEELLAHLAETGKHQKLWSKIVAAVRDALRKMGFALEITESDLLGILAGAQRVVQNDGISRTQAATMFSFAGRTANTADRMALSSAQSRIASGESAESVRQDTNWFRGDDSQWRFEIDDSQAKLQPPLPSKGQSWGDIYDNQMQGRGYDSPLVVSDLLDHPALFAAYPELMDMPVGDKPGRGANFNPGSSLSPRMIEIGRGLSMNGVLSSLLHEIQHGIQNIEGFASGGSVESMGNTLAQSPQLAKAFTYMAFVERVTGETVNFEPSRLQSSDPVEIVEELTAMLGAEMDNEIGAETQSWLASEGYGRFEADHEVWSVAESLADDAQSALQNAISLTDGEAYMRLSGEIEARNVEARRGMTAQERSSTSPEATRDRPAGQAIVVMNGTEIQNAPAPANSRTGQTNTPAFREWFGDSKVVDEQGEPLVVYHGTAADITEFDSMESRDIGFHFGDQEAANYILERERYNKAPNAPLNAMPVYLSIKNPLRVKDSNFSSSGFILTLMDQVNSQGIEGVTSQSLQDLEMKTSKLAGRPNAMKEASIEVMRFLESKGYDGLVYKNRKEGRGDSYVAFTPNQIKSATGNNGDFDSGNPDIRYSREKSKEGTKALGDSIKAAISGVPELAGTNVIQSASDLPAKAQAEMKRQGVKPNTVRGLYLDGEIYVVADNIVNAQDGIRVAVHEAVGHKGIRGVLGEGIDNVMLSLYRSLPNTPQGREALAEVKREYSFLDASKRADRIQIAEEMVAHLLEKGIRPKAWQRAMSKIRELLRTLIPAIAWTYTDVLSMGEQSREYLRGRKAGTGDKALRYSLGSNERISGGNLFDDFTEADRTAAAKMGPRSAPRRIMDAWKEVTNNASLKIRQGMVDRLAGFKAMDEALLGERMLNEDISRSSWVLGRMANAANGALNAMLHTGRLEMDPTEKVLTLKGDESKGLGSVFARLASNNDPDSASAEVQRFMGWIAGNRSRKLLNEGRENLFTETEISAMENWDRGALADGRNRAETYADVFTEFQTYRDDVLAIADQSGLLKKGMEEADAILFMADKHGIRGDLVKRAKKARRDANRADDVEVKEMAEAAEGKALADLQEAIETDIGGPAFNSEYDQLTTDQRELWANEFYVPFYRISEEDNKPTGQLATGGLSRQQAYKRLKGGTQNLNDLLENTMMNFHHLIDASLKNQAAQQAVENAQLLGMAHRVSASNRDTKTSTFVLEDGEQAYYQIDDPLVFQSLTALTTAGMNGTAMKIMRGFKRLFTNMTTITPQFMVANLIRDSLQAVATNEVSKNVFGNVISGARSYSDEKIKAQMMAAGASFNFGHLYGGNPDELRAQLTRDMRNVNLIDGPKAIPDALRNGWTWWNDVNNTAENINRAAIFTQNQDKGALKAAFESRDLIDFSAHGAWPAVRILIDVVPFLNARIQGLDKIYRSGVKPGANVLKGLFGGDDPNVSDKQSAGRFWSVTGTLAMATMMLYLHNYDDEEYKKLEDWQKDTYWFIRFGDQGYFIPKPFEVGAISTMVERITEQFVNDEATGKLFRRRMLSMLTDTFSFSPVPQAVQPLLDIYSNYDAFTERPIESMGMDRMSPELRRRASTSKVGDWISQGLNATLGAVGRPDTNPFALSPVQVDHLIGGYLGQVGTWVAGSGDVAWRVATGKDKPAQRWYEYQPVRRFYKSLGDEDRYTRYGTVFYEGLREAGRAHADVRELREAGRLADAAELATDKQDILRIRTRLNRAQSDLRKINRRIEVVRKSDQDGELKRQQVDRLRAIKNQIQRALGEQVLKARAS